MRPIIRLSRRKPMKEIGPPVNSQYPRVAILMTVYNAAAYVRESIDSLTAQTFPDWELIAVDDGSTDASLSVLKEFSDARIRIFPLEKNVGRTTALRFAFDQVRSEYIAVLDADDISSPDRLARQIDFLDQHPDVALVASWARYIDAQGKVFGEFKPPVNECELLDCLGWNNPIVHSSAMYRRKLAEEVGGYPSDIVWAQDFGLILALAQRYNIAMIGDYLCQLRILTSSLTRSLSNQILVANETLELFRRAASMVPLSARGCRLNRRSIAIAEIKLGLVTLRNKSIFAGLKLMIHGVFFSPSTLWSNGPVRRFFGAEF